MDFLPAGRGAWAEAQAPAIIPLPQKMEVQPGSFSAPCPLSGRKTKILVNTGAEETGRYLAAELRRRASVELDVVPKAKAKDREILN
jgi:hypothetical protein